MNSPIEALVRQHLPKGSAMLDGSWCAVGLDIDWLDINEAVARTPAAFEHLIGERPLAFFSMEERYPESFNGYLLFTDRRIVGRFPRLNGTSGAVHFRYAYLQGTQRKKGMLKDALAVMHAGQVHELAFGIFHDKLQPFIDAVCAIPPDQREPAPFPLAQTSPQDPTGAFYACEMLMEDDPRAHFLLEYVELAHASGRIPAPIASDLVARLTLQHRNESCGRGVHDGSFLSPLGKDDLSHVLVAIYGQPLAHAEQPYRTLTFDSRSKQTKLLDAIDKVAFGIDLASDWHSLSFGGLAAAAIGSALGPRHIHHFTIMIAESGPSSLFRLFDRQTPLSHAEPLLVDDVCRTLDRLEAALLLRRCAYGWEPSVQALLTVPSSDLIARFEAVTGPFDARVLGRPTENRME